ncbi:hypothetical protein CHUAL_007330 [Chamberlinius hualienensis]
MGVIPPPEVDETTPVINFSQNFTRSESVCSDDNWMPQQVSEERFLDTNANLDLEPKAIETSSAIQESEEQPSQSLEVNNIDEIDIWEYGIPEVPPPPQFDNDYVDVSHIGTDPLDSEAEIPDVVVCEVPPEFQNQFSEVERDVYLTPDLNKTANTEKIIIDEHLIREEPIVHEHLIREEPIVHEHLIREEPIIDEHLIREEPIIDEHIILEEPIIDTVLNEKSFTADEQDEVVGSNQLYTVIEKSQEVEVAKEELSHKPLQQMTTEEMAETEELVIRKVYRRPVVSFSISTYKTRDSEEVSYQSKLLKSDSFSTRAVSDSNVEPPLLKYETSSLPRTTTFNSVTGQSKAITEAIKASTNIEIRTKDVEIKSDGGLQNGNLRRTQSEMKLDCGSGEMVANASQMQSASSEQEKLQREYKKLHTQFMLWQQQLMHNQALLQQQQISSESTTETLNKIQELQQQFSSLPSITIETKDEKQISLGTNSLDRPKSQVSSLTTCESNTNSLERRPRIGPKPWRPASVAVTAWTSKRSDSDDSLNVIKNDRRVQINGTSSTAISKEKIVPMAQKPNFFVNKGPVAAPNVTRWPVVKGFVIDPQPKSKVVINSDKTVSSVTISKPPLSLGNIEVKIESDNKIYNQKSSVATIEIENKNGNKNYMNGSAVNYINKSQPVDSGKKFTTVVNLAQQQQAPQSVPPPPPPPPSVALTGVAKPVKRSVSTQKSVSSEEGRDELMVAIKDFGGRSGLRKISSSDARWQQRYGSAY